MSENKVKPPVALVLLVIDECDGRCQMCGIWKRKPRRPLAPETLVRILSDRELSDSLTHINITGGEPCTHPEPVGLLRAISDHSPQLREVNINISGLIPSSTQAAVPAFREGLRKEVDLVVTFSLDGVGRIHDQIRGVKHGFEQTMASIQWCREFAAQTAGLRLLLNCTVSRNNYGDCRRVLDLAEELGIRVSLTYAAANGLFLSNLAMTDGFKVKDDAAIAVAEQFTDAANDDRLPLTERHYYTLAAEMAVGGSRNVPCVFQDRGIFLDIDGTVYPCGTAPDLPYARLPDEPFGPAYYGAHGDAVRAALRARYCSQCPSNSYHGLASGVWLEVLKMRRGRS